MCDAGIASRSFFTLSEGALTAPLRLRIIQGRHSSRRDSNTAGLCQDEVINQASDVLTVRFV